MRRSILILAAALCLPAAAASADELIRIPTADRVAEPRAEYKLRLTGPNEGYGTLFVPAGLNYELMFRYYNGEDGRHRIEGGGQVQLLPDSFSIPGVAVGIWDVTNSSPWGRRAFVVVTKSFDTGHFLVFGPIQRVQLTGGVGTGRFGGPLAGARVDLPLRLSLIAEYDARRFNAGIWFTPVAPLVLKGELHNGTPYVGAQLRLKF